MAVYKWMLLVLPMMLASFNHTYSLQMPLSGKHQNIRTNTVGDYQRQQHQYIHCQLGHVIPGHAILVAVCILMLPMLDVAAEHKQLTTTHHTNPADLCVGHVTFSNSPLVLLSLSNVLPAIVLQNKVVKSKMRLSHSLCHSRLSSIHHVFLGLGLSVSYCLKMMMVVVLLLLLSGDIETNPGPVGEHTLTIYSNKTQAIQFWEFMGESNFVQATTN